ncbi:MAG: tetratricopeptide repeat protein, partial [Bacteroidales bacterium]|nr:tetratricopeptide repeat protein [Bacteroidales bacterium]
MKILLFYILFALLSQQTTDNGQQTSSTVAEPVEAPNDVVVPSTSSGTCTDTLNVSSIEFIEDARPCASTGDSVTYYESQIHLADSLYKNYLPQYNFDEVKAAVVFFEKSSSHQVSKSPSRDNQNNSLTHSLGDSVTRRLGDLNFLSARAHYYHAVGLTERDDVVGACEHYLRALEIMEEYWNSGIQDFRTSGSQKSRDPGIQNPEIRFLALTYNRLGRLFLNENYCDLAIVKYRKALKYVEILGNNDSKANVLKELGNSYQLANKPDSALYYYNESLKYNSSLTNKLDVEKSIAQILFDKGEKDSAYVLIKNNLDKIENYGPKNSYYGVLGEMYYKDMQYDSAICYLEKSVTSNDYYIKYMSSTTLSA